MNRSINKTQNRNIEIKNDIICESTCSASWASGARRIGIAKLAATFEPIYIFSKKQTNKQTNSKNRKKHIYTRSDPFGHRHHRLIDLWQAWIQQYEFVIFNFAQRENETWRWWTTPDIITTIVAIASSTTKQFGLIHDWWMHRLRRYCCCCFTDHDDRNVHRRCRPNWRVVRVVAKSLTSSSQHSTKYWGKK